MWYWLLILHVSNQLGAFLDTWLRWPPIEFPLYWKGLLLYLYFAGKSRLVSSLVSCLTCRYFLLWGKLDQWLKPINRYKSVYYNYFLYTQYCFSFESMSSRYFYFRFSIEFSISHPEGFFTGIRILVGTGSDPNPIDNVIYCFFDGSSCRRFMSAVRLSHVSCNFSKNSSEYSNASVEFT